MSIKSALEETLTALPEEKQRVVLDFARFLQGRQEVEDWKNFGESQLARAYGPDEPEYTEADLKRG